MNDDDTNTDKEDDSAPPEPLREELWDDALRRAFAGDVDNVVGTTFNSNLLPHKSLDFSLCFGAELGTRTWRCPEQQASSHLREAR